MKLTVLGGGGVRSPMLARSIVGQAERVGVDEVWFQDVDPDKLRIYGGLARRVAAAIDPRVRFELSADPEASLRGADFVITTLRVGGDFGRVLDERIALERGVLGQETTGAGGFAMAMRSIPALLEYCSMARALARPGAPIFNFTNPSGLVAQALRDAGHDTVYGICDGPSGFLGELSRLLGVDPGRLVAECFGLNHLSWFRSVELDGRELVGSLIADPRLYARTEMRVFPPELLARLGMLPSGYLYYYYRREEALANIARSRKTRGETILEINRAMSAELERLEGDVDASIAAYLKYYAMRESGYMAIESGSARTGQPEPRLDLAPDSVDDGGYAGVALDFVGAVVSGRRRRMILSVPNRGSVDGLGEEDVVEVSCLIDADGARPVKIGRVPEPQLCLMRQVKLYERLAVQAIRERSLATAAEALMAHPLIGSWTLGMALARAYAEAHREYAGEWV